MTGNSGGYRSYTHEESSSPRLPRGRAQVLAGRRGDHDRRYRRVANRGLGLDRDLCHFPGLAVRFAVVLPWPSHR